jgi:hypothetical protein
VQLAGVVDVRLVRREVLLPLVELERLRVLALVRDVGLGARGDADRVEDGLDREKFSMYRTPSSRLFATSSWLRR